MEILTWVPMWGAHRGSHWAAQSWHFLLLLSHDPRLLLPSLSWGPAAVPLLPLPRVALDLSILPTEGRAGVTHRRGPRCCRILRSPSSQMCGAGCTRTLSSF